MVTHDEKRFVLVSLFDKLDSFVGDDFCSVARYGRRTFGTYEDWIEIVSLTRDDFPIVETTWLCG